MRLCYLFLAMVLCASAHAQERSAVNSHDDQVTWSFISQQANAMTTKVANQNARIDQIATCGRKGMVFAPGTAGVDSQSCIAPALPASVITAITNAQTTVNNAAATANNVLNCSNNGQMYDKSSNACVTIVKSSLVAKTVMSGSAMKGGGPHASYSVATCPAGTVMIGCSGARNANITDTCDESECGLVGYGPVNSTTCRVTVDTDKGTNPTIWATCLKIQ